MSNTATKSEKGGKAGKAGATSKRAGRSVNLKASKPAGQALGPQIAHIRGEFAGSG